MKSHTKFYRAVYLPVMPLGNFKSAPAEIGSTIPNMPTSPPRPLWHPQLGATALGEQIMPLEPSNDAILGEVRPLEWLTDPVGVQEPHSGDE